MKLIPIDHVYVVNSNNLEERAGLYVDAETGVVYFFNGNGVGPCPRYDSNGRIMAVPKEQIPQVTMRFARAEAAEADRRRTRQV